MSRISRARKALLKDQYLDSEKVIEFKQVKRGSRND